MPAVETDKPFVPNCINIPSNRLPWHWKQFERARFPSYQRNRSLFGRMLNDLYDEFLEGFKGGVTAEMSLRRGELRMEREGKEIVERTYRTAYENTAREFAEGWERNLKQDEEETEDLATLAALAVRDYFTAQLFQRQQQITLEQQIGQILSSHTGIARRIVTEQVRSVLGLPPGQPLPSLTTSQINRISLQARNRFRTDVTPTHSRRFSVTETVSASNLGILALARARQQRTGVAIYKGWLSQRDARVRDSHVVANGTQIPLDQLFRVGNSLLAFPGDWSHGARPEELINCRCVLIFISQR